MTEIRLATLLLVALLAACASQRPMSPAPVVQRTGADGARPLQSPPAGQPPAAVQSSQPVGSARPGAPAATGAAPAGGEPAVTVQTAPARGSGVEVRPLEPRPGEPRTIVVPSTAGGQPALSGSIRTTPRGLKRPYSDALLAEMQALDSTTQAGAGGAHPAAAAPIAAAAQTPAPATAAAAAPPGGVSDAGFAWPAGGRVLQGFAEPKNVGIAIDGKPGDPVYAAADGRVIFSAPGPRGYGNLVIVKHDADTVSVYAHNRSLLVKEGASVRRGQRIAELGDSGTDRPQLHFEIRKQGKPVDPQKLLPRR